MLLDRADSNLQRKDGDTALHIACYERQSTIAELPLSFGAAFVIPNTKGDTAFLASVRGNNTEILKLMLNSIPHSPFIVSLGVVYACRFGHLAVFNLFAKQLEYTTQIANLLVYACRFGHFQKWLMAKAVMDVTNEIEEASCCYINNYCSQIEMSMGLHTFSSRL